MEPAYMTEYKEKHAQHQQLITHLRRSRLGGCQAAFAHSWQHRVECSSYSPTFKATRYHWAAKEIADGSLHFRALKRLEQLLGTRRRLEHPI